MTEISGKKSFPYKNCLLCPRRCGVNRESGYVGFCGETSALRLAFAGIHRGEEPPITGTGGSGTIFVSGCNLGCLFYQNYQISKSAESGLKPGAAGQELRRTVQPLLRKNVPGRIVDGDEFAEICLMLRDRGAENINIVTGSHAVPALVKGLEAARGQGLDIPILWNSSGYEGAETLELLSGIVDVYLPDLKTLDTTIAARFFNAPDYPEHAAVAILKMMDFRELRYSRETLISGVMVRHLVIPGFPESTRRVLAWFAEHCKTRALLSLMTQYTPVKMPGVTADIPDRYISGDEYETILSMLDEYGIDNGFCQELVTGSAWLPDFSRPNPFSSELSVPVWHCLNFQN